MIVKPRPTIVLFGDSITQLGFGGGSGAECSSGWTGMLANAYARRADVLNRGFSGYNTRHALDVLPSVFGPTGESHCWVGRPLFVSVFFGANDASLPSDDELCQHVPVDEYERNLRKIVRNIADVRFGAEDDDKKGGSGGKKKEGGHTPPIVLITPPPVHAETWDEYMTTNFDCLSPRSNEASRLYGDRVKLVAREMGCSVVDSFSLLRGNESGDVYKGYLEDGLHLNGEGNRLLFEGFMEVIRRDHAQLAPMVDGDGKYGESGIPVEGELWKELMVEKRRPAD